MTEQKSFRINCNSITHRQGFIEVTADVHEGFVNLEAWDIDADIDLESVQWITDSSISDEGVVGNVELEMSAEQARKLGEILIALAENQK